MPTLPRQNDCTDCGIGGSFPQGYGHGLVIAGSQRIARSRVVVGQDQYSPITPSQHRRRFVQIKSDAIRFFL